MGAPSSFHGRHGARLVNRSSEIGAFHWIVAALFTVALGYGVILPVLPLFLGRILVSPGDAAVSFHTGWLTGAYMFAVFAFAPLWGFVSDRVGRRPVILVGLAGYVVTVALFGLIQSIWLTYFVRTLSGALVSAVLPVAQAYVSETSTDENRARRLAWMSGASLAGFLIGPALSGAVYGAGRAMPWIAAMGDGMILLPLYVAALLGLPVWIGVFRAVPNTARNSAPSNQGRRAPRVQSGQRLLILLAMNLIATFGLGSFEVGITLQGRQSLGLDVSGTGIMFAECSLVMMLVQAAVYFWPSVIRLKATYVTAPSFLAMGVGFLLLPGAKDLYVMLVLVALLAGGSGLLLAGLTYLVSGEPERLGFALGLQAAALSLGQALGSVVQGWLFGVMALSSYWIIAGFMSAGALVAGLGIRYRAR